MTGMNMVSLAWHYTITPIYFEILKSGYLKPSDSYLTPGEKPVLWFSSNPFWEETASKSLKDHGMTIHLSMEETAQKAGGLVRFAFPLELLVRWPRIGQQANIKSKERKILEEAGIRRGADPRQWYGTLERINVDDCIAIERMKMETRTWETLVDGIIGNQ